MQIRFYVYIAAGFVVAFFAVAVLWVFGWGWFSQSTANYRGETDKRNQVEANGSYRIGAYDHFFNLCQHVQSDEASIGNLTAEQQTTTDAQRKTVIAASLTALANDRADAITQYNADARKSYTLGQFRSSDLPFELSLNAQETSCTAVAQPSSSQPS